MSRAYRPICSIDRLTVPLCVLTVVVVAGVYRRRIIYFHKLSKRCAAAANNWLALTYAGFFTLAHHAAVPGDGYGLRVRVVPTTSGRGQRGTPSPRGRRARRRWPRVGRRRVQPIVVCTGWLVHAVRQAKSAARRTWVSCILVHHAYMIQCYYIIFGFTESSNNLLVLWLPRVNGTNIPARYSIYLYEYMTMGIYQ